jgi:hypothetical protein
MVYLSLFPHVDGFPLPGCYGMNLTTEAILLFGLPSFACLALSHQNSSETNGRSDPGFISRSALALIRYNSIASDRKLGVLKLYRRSFNDPQVGTFIRPVHLNLTF